MNKKNDQSLHGKLKAGKSKRSKQLLKIQPTLEQYIAGVYVLEPNKDLTSFSELSIKLLPRLMLEFSYLPDH